MKMKSLAVIFAGLFLTLSGLAGESFGFGVWYGTPEGVGSKSVEGLTLGIPIYAGAKVEGASLALIGNSAQRMSGFQWPWIGFNYAGTMKGVQLGFLNFIAEREKDLSVQLGFFNQCGKGGIMLGFINNGQNNATFQLGLININKNGMLPIMIFVNFARDLF